MKWLAGLLEGEGCFSAGNRNHPHVTLHMTDRDVVERAAIVMGGAFRGPYTHSRALPGRPYKLFYAADVTGKAALTLMLNLFPYMGDRRRARINQVLSDWEHSADHRFPEKPKRGR